jgi:hypothetical protein
MVLDARIHPDTSKREGVRIAGFTPCTIEKVWKITAVKARWPDGAESDWQVGERDNVGYKDQSFHFDKAKAVMPETATTNWVPIVGPCGYVEFYHGKGNPPTVVNSATHLYASFITLGRPQTDFDIYQLFGTEECFVGDTFAGVRTGVKHRPINGVDADAKGHLRIPCPQGKNIFAVELGPAKSQVTVNVDPNTVTPVRIDYVEIPCPAKGTSEVCPVISLYGHLHFRIETIVEAQQPLHPK